MPEKYHKKQINVRKHKRFDPRINKKVDVRNYDRNQKFRQFKNISMEKGREFFDKRSPTQQEIDLGIEARMMFVLPNELWLNIPNVVDIWGIDGYDPPIVDFLPPNPLPFQIVEYKDEFWVANAKGKFTTPEKKREDIEKYQKPIKEVIEFDTEEKRKTYEKITKKNAIWNNKITSQYKKWLKQDRDYEVLADKLSLTGSDLTLAELRDFYNSLKLSDKELRKVMFKVYNNKYKDNISSYTKDFQDFFDRRYYDLLESKIQAEKNRLKELQKDPKKVKRSKEQYHTQAMFNFRFPIIRKMVNSQKYTNISDFNIEDTLKSYPKWEDQDIVDDLIERYNAGELIDSDVREEQEDIAREEAQWKEQYSRWAQQEEAYNEKYRIQWELEREMEKKDPVAYAKFKKEELERWRASIPEMSKWARTRIDPM